MDKPRPTQKDIARLARVTQATVSLALNNHPRLSPEIRERVQTIAKKIGYVPDPYLAGLSAHKKQKRQPRYQATLAWLTNWPAGGRDWRTISTFVHYHEGALRRAAELGYKLEEHDLSKPGMTPARMEQILRAKNIPGLLLPPQPLPLTRLEFPFERFSVVTFGYSLVEPKLHMTTHHHFRSTEILFRQLLARGYKRPGLVGELDDEVRIERIPSSAFQSEQRDLPESQRVPVLMEHNLTKSSFIRWYRRWKPDVIVTLWDLVYPWMVEAGLRVPDDVGLVLLSVRKQDGFFAGIWENPRLVGARGVELLIDLVHRSDRGVPEVPSCLLIEGTWMEGRTVRPPA